MGGHSLDAGATRFRQDQVLDEHTGHPLAVIAGIEDEDKKVPGDMQRLTRTLRETWEARGQITVKKGERNSKTVELTTSK